MDNGIAAGAIIKRPGSTEKLPDLFSQDLEETLPAEPGSSEKHVIFLDTPGRCAYCSSEPSGGAP